MVTNISHIGIVGGGKMGTSLFNWLSQYNDNLVWIVRSGYERGQKKYKRKLQRSFKNGLISQGDFETRTVKHTITNNLDALQDCDLVIESISENLNAKKALVSHLFDVVKSNALIATNSSSYLPWQLSDNKIQRQRIVGLHFFYPVDFKGIVEFIGGEVEEQQIKNVKHFLDKKKCEILYQNKDNAFLLNRLMLHLQVEAFRLHNSKGYSIPEIDKAVDTFLFPIGIFFMMDHIGLDILEMAVKNYMSLEEQLDGLIDFQYFLNEKVNAGHLGLKTNVGIYDYSKDVHFESLDEDRLKEIAKQLADTYFKALNNYVGHGYSTNKELTNAMDVYLDCETECWKELLV